MVSRSARGITGWPSVAFPSRIFKRRRASRALSVSLDCRITRPCALYLSHHTAAWRRVPSLAR
jgi:hypothetical protein